MHLIPLQNVNKVIHTTDRLRHKKGGKKKPKTETKHLDTTVIR